MTLTTVNYDTASAPELLKQAKRVLDADPPQSPALLLAAVNKALSEVAPGEEPAATAKRLATERNRWGIEAGYESLLYYYEDSLDPDRFSFWQAPGWEWETHFWEVADDLVRILKEDNG